MTCLFRMSRFNMYEARTFWGGTQFRPSPRSKGSSCWTSSADVLDSNEVPECPCPMIRDLGSINFSLQNPHRNTKFWHVCGSRFQRPKKHHQKPKKKPLAAQSQDIRSKISGLSPTNPNRYHIVCTIKEAMTLS